MRLLLTRAANEAARTRGRLEAAGHAVLISPVTRLVATGKPWPRFRPDGVVATSARAFVASERPWDAAALPLFLVGYRTATAARAAGFAGPAEVAETAARLAAMLGALPPKRLLYLAGVDRKPELEMALAAARHRLTVVETYEAQAADALTAETETALLNREVGAVLHYSERSAALFLRLAEAAGVDTRAMAHLCLSGEIAAVFVAHPDVAIAEAPHEDALLALLDRR